MPELHSPLLLLLLPAIFTAWFLLGRRARPPAVRFPTVRGIVPARTLRLRLRWLPTALRAAAIVLVVIAAARPREGIATTVIRREGLAIQMVLDRSGSMDEELAIGGRPAPKIEIVKRIFQDFVAGGEDLAGRVSDLIGLTTFARFAEENCPLVSLHEPLIAAVRNLSTVPPFLTAARDDPQARGGRRPEPPERHGHRRGALARRPRPDRRRGGPRARARRRRRVPREGQGRDPPHGRQAERRARPPRGGGPRGEERRQGVRDRPRRPRRRGGDDLRPPRHEAHLRRRARRTPRRAEGTRGKDRRQVVPRHRRRRPRARSTREIDRLEKTDLGEVEFRSYRERFALPLLLGIALLILAEVLAETFFRRAP